MSDNIYFNFATACRQFFAFPPDVIKYSIKGCNGSTWLKLTKSCKYFHCKRKALVLKSTTFDARGCITATDRSIHRFWESVDKLPCELFLAGKLTISAPLTLFKPKILSCKLRELNIVKVTLGIKEFEYLVDSEILDTFCVKNAEIRYSDKSVVPLEELFEGIPNVTCLAFDCNKAINANSFHQMTETSRNRKLISYDFTGIRNIKEEHFVLFTQNHAARNCTITLGAISGQFETILEKMLAKWQPQSVKPTITHDGKSIPRPNVITYQRNLNHTSSFRPQQQRNLETLNKAESGYFKKQAIERANIFKIQRYHALAEEKEEEEQRRRAKRRHEEEDDDWD